MPNPIGLAGYVAPRDLLHPLEFPAEDRSHVVQRQTCQDVAGCGRAAQVVEAQAVQAGSGIGSAVLTGGFIRVIASPLNAAVEVATWRRPGFPFGGRQRRRVGVHPRVATVGDASTDPAHMPPNHLARRAGEDEDLVMWSRLHGPGVQAVVKSEAERSFVGAVKTSIYRSFRELAWRVGPVRLEAACARAVMIGEPRLAHVRNILDRNLEFTDPADFVAPKTTAAMNENVRGPDYFRGA